MKECSNHKNLRLSNTFWEYNVNTVMTKIISSELTGPSSNDHIQEEPHAALLFKLRKHFWLEHSSVWLTLCLVTMIVSVTLISMSYVISFQVCSHMFTRVFQTLRAHLLSHQLSLTSSLSGQHHSVQICLHHSLFHSIKASSLHSLPITSANTSLLNLAKCISILLSHWN